MKRFFITLITVLTFVSCEGLLEPTITQSDVVGTWNFYTSKGSWYGNITITKYGDCSVKYLGHNLWKYEEDEYWYENGTFKISGNKVIIDIPSWNSGTFKIIASPKKSNRYLINPDINGTTVGMADALIQKDEISSALEFVAGSANW